MTRDELRVEHVALQATTFELQAATTDLVTAPYDPRRTRAHLAALRAHERALHVHAENLVIWADELAGGARWGSRRWTMTDPEATIVTAYQAGRVSYAEALRRLLDLQVPVSEATRWLATPPAAPDRPHDAAHHNPRDTP